MKKVLLFSLFVMLGIPIAVGKAKAGIPKITPEELRGMLDAPDLIIIDVRRPSHWEASTHKITGAVREQPGDVTSWADRYPKGKTIVLYCA